MKVLILISIIALSSTFAQEKGSPDCHDCSIQSSLKNNTDENLSEIILPAIQPMEHCYKEAGSACQKDLKYRGCSWRTEPNKSDKESSNNRIYNIPNNLAELNRDFYFDDKFIKLKKDYVNNTENYKTESKKFVKEYYDKIIQNGQPANELWEVYKEYVRLKIRNINKLETTLTNYSIDNRIKANTDAIAPEKVAEDILSTALNIGLKLSGSIGGAAKTIYEISETIAETVGSNLPDQSKKSTASRLRGQHSRLKGNYKITNILKVMRDELNEKIINSSGRKVVRETMGCGLLPKSIPVEFLPDDCIKTYYKKCPKTKCKDGAEEVKKPVSSFGRFSCKSIENMKKNWKDSANGYISELSRKLFKTIGGKIQGSSGKENGDRPWRKENITISPSEAIPLLCYIFKDPKVKSSYVTSKQIDVPLERVFKSGKFDIKMPKTRGNLPSYKNCFFNSSFTNKNKYSKPLLCKKSAKCQESYQSRTGDWDEGKFLTKSCDEGLCKEMSNEICSNIFNNITKHKINLSYWYRNKQQCPQILGYDYKKPK